MHNAPFPGAQGGANLPLIGVVGQGDLAGILVPGHRFRYVLLGRLQADLAPGPLLFTILQAALQLVEFVGGGPRIVGGDALNGKNGQFASAPAGIPVARLADEIAHRIGNGGIQRLAFGQLAVRQVVQGRLGPDWPVCFQLAARACPDIVAVHALARDQGIEHWPARLGWFDLGQPEFFRFVEDAPVVAGEAGLLAVAGDIRLGGDQPGVFAIHVVPVGAFAQPADPVGAQFFGDISLVVALKESAHADGVALVHPHAQPVVFDVGRQFMVAELAAGPLQLVAVTAAEGVTGGEKGKVVAFLCYKRE